LSSSPPTKVSGLSSQEFSRGEPLSSVEAHGNVALPMMNGENYENTQRPQQNQVYARRRSLVSTSTVTNGGCASNAEAAGAVAYSAPDAFLALLASTSSSPSIVEVALLDSARLEGDIVSQLYFGTTSSLEGMIMVLHW